MTAMPQQQFELWRFCQSASNDSRFFDEEENEIDQKRIDKEVDRLYELYLPVSLGLASSVEEVGKWSLDQRIVMSNLASKILSEQVDRESTAIHNGITSFWNELQKANRNKS